MQFTQRKTQEIKPKKLSIYPPVDILSTTTSSHPLANQSLFWERHPNPNEAEEIETIKRENCFKERSKEKQSTRSKL